MCYHIWSVAYQEIPSRTLVGLNPNPSTINRRKRSCSVNLQMILQNYHQQVVYSNVYFNSYDEGFGRSLTRVRGMCSRKMTEECGNIFGQSVLVKQILNGFCGQMWEMAIAKMYTKLLYHFVICPVLMRMQLVEH